MAALIGAALLGTPTESSAQTGPSPAVSGEQITLGSAAGATYEQTLAAGLKCRLPSEFAYVRVVAAKVRDGSLPQNLVDSTFFYARRQPPYPFVYFKFALNARAKKIGVIL
ncbi:MAG: hypothetical protein QM811_06250 [Pirellulales bacterium]